MTFAEPYVKPDGFLELDDDDLEALERLCAAMLAYGSRPEWNIPRCVRFDSWHDLAIRRMWGISVYQNPRQRVEKLRSLLADHKDAEVYEGQIEDWVRLAQGSRSVSGCVARLHRVAAKSGSGEMPQPKLAYSRETQSRRQTDWTPPTAA